MIVKVDVAPAVESVEELHRYAGVAHRLPKHLRDEILALITTKEALMVAVEAEQPGCAGTVVPGPRLLALLANLRAGGYEEA